ncbi:mersacidin/lichenicidin family type 2 lantibiotic [Hyalangium gracile]|uniref:mersacidin/lichenicidin family type 2 lantibiotic n=1 Tax=Hyalangium gracile TaxID=394092 RepID=UPI001CCAC0DB|nr:mersacidin/lichenicidin family type 2 lantibiotic [Hyalangium gracile]
MKRETIIRAWKDPQFRASLTSEERAALPECPAGPAFTELEESALEEAVGGGAAFYEFDEGCICSKYTGTRTFPTTTRDFVINQRDLVVLEAFDVVRF